ncbi:equilibrative nucleoside transporter 3-like [Tribolium madens]|uniref:equilibrative nucleoside transporter 3-like n=1 Tax=Tribolium madens TaxID=41895 RepID=UPI001CF742CC|nr:equilibrative nucleoside transporter 3-like [Tribolium madens]
MTREEEDNGGPTDQMLSTENPPDKMEDKYHMAIVLFYSLGVASVIPTHFFPTATDYWMYKFRDPDFHGNYTEQNRTGMQAEFVADYSIVSNVSNVCFLVVTIIFLKRLSLVKRIMGALCGALVMFAITCVFVQVDTDEWQRGFFIATLVIGFLLTGFCAVFMVSLFQLVTRFPPVYLAAMLSGHSLCGIFAALVQIFSLSIGASSKTSGLTYFSIGMFFIFLTLTGFIATLNKSQFFNYHITKEVETVKPKMTKNLFLSVLNKVKYYLGSMIIVLGCTIMLHPGLLSLVVSVGKGNGKKWNDVFFVPVITFLLHFSFDYMGREVAGYWKKPKSGLIIFIASLLRACFVPMFMLCNAQPRSHLPVIFDQDYAYIIFVIIFAFTNGYLVNLCVIHIPLATEEEEKPLAMILIIIFMIVSLGACSFISSALVKSL